MGVNHFTYFGSTKFDLRSDTIDASHLIEGFTAHDKSGEVIVGTLRTAPLEPLVYDYNIGYVDNGTWKYENPTRTYTDIYEVRAGQPYAILLGQTVGSRFRAMFTSTDVRTITKGNVAGIRIVNTNSPASFSHATYTPSEDGYILVAKDNVGVSGLKSYVFNADAVFE